jgi:predicted molibdopterin-dependent oxidoreductase YjgC
MTNSIEDCTTKADVILITGTNTSECHPIIANLIREAVMKRGSKLIVVDPKKIDLVEYADIRLQPKPGNNVAWINGFMNVILSKNLEKREYIEERTEGFEELKKVVEKYTPEEVEKITGIDAKKLIEAATLFGEAEKASILYAMGITQHSNGTDNVKSLVNLSLITGNVGKEGGGVNPLRGQNNVQGACDMGGLPNVYPGYQPVDNEENCKKFSEAWGSSCNANRGKPLTEIPELVHEGKLKALYIMGENPLVSEPFLKHVEEVFDADSAKLIETAFNMIDNNLKQHPHQPSWRY